MRFDELNDSNYLLFAIKNYDNPQAVTEDDFYDDLKRIKYIKRLLKRYKNSGELRTHLILNHFIVLFNVLVMLEYLYYFLSWIKNCGHVLRVYFLILVGYLNTLTQN